MRNVTSSRTLGYDTSTSRSGVAPLCLFNFDHVKITKEEHNNFVDLKEKNKRLRRLLKMANDILVDEEIEWNYADEINEILKNN
jgi:hypothetical protein